GTYRTPLVLARRSCPLHVFSLMLRLPLTSTLFPYTTLFRSEVALDPDELNGALRRAILLLATGGDPQRELALDSRAVVALADELDRKSTRLNSSHQIISYAVFCLKKKTTSDQTMMTGTPTRT